MSVIFVTIGILKILVSSMSLIFAMVKGNAPGIHFRYMSKDDAINIVNGSNLVDKKDLL